MKCSFCDLLSSQANSNAMNRSWIDAIQENETSEHIGYDSRTPRWVVVFRHVEREINDIIRFGTRRICCLGPLDHNHIRRCLLTSKNIRGKIISYQKIIIELIWVSHRLNELLTQSDIVRVERRGLKAVHENDRQLGFIKRRAKYLENNIRLLIYQTTNKTFFLSYPSIEFWASFTPSGSFLVYK